MTLKAAIFDWDGTITDSNNIKTEAFVELFQNACPQAAGYIREYQQNRGGISRFEKFRHYIRHFFTAKSLLPNWKISAAATRPSAGKSS